MDVPAATIDLDQDSHDSLQSCTEEVPERVLETRESAATLITLPNDSLYTPNTDWVWIGAYLGIQCGLGAAAPGAVAWEAATLWERVLKPFWPWFR